MPFATLELHLLFEKLVFILQTAFFLVLYFLLISFIEPLLISFFVCDKIIGS